MITLSSNFGELYAADPALMQILCLKSAFGGTPLEEDSWVQTEDGKPCGYIARNGGRLYIYSKCENIDELKEFINTVGYSEIFTSKETALKLNLILESEYTVLFKKVAKSGDFSPEAIGLSALYSGLAAGEDSDIDLPSFETFAPDISHRLRHGAAAAVVKNEGSAMAFLCPEGAIINGISVKKELRRQGFGSQILKELLAYCDGDVLVCAGDKNTLFYTKNGFEPIDTAVIAR